MWRSRAFTTARNGPSDTQTLYGFTPTYALHLPLSEYTGHHPLFSFALHRLMGHVNNLFNIYERILYTIRGLLDDKTALQSIKELE